MIFSHSVFSQDDELDFKKYKLDDLVIEFKSSHVFDEGDIEALIKTGKSKTFEYNEFCTDILRIEKFYFDNGFIDASVDTNISINEEKNVIVAKFIIDEKLPYYINAIEYIGIEDIGQVYKSRLFIEEEPLIKVSDAYNKNKLVLEISRIVTFLNNNGYANAINDPPEIIKIESNNPNVKNKINIKLFFHLGNLYRFGKTKVNIEDNRYSIKFFEIYRELEYSENDFYSKEKLIESENRLNRISILENARILFDYIDSSNNIINLKIDASVRNKYEVQPEILGYDINNLFYVGGGLTFSDRYFLGGGRTFSAKLEGLVHSEDVNGIEFSMNVFQPYIFNSNKITGEWKIGTTLFNQDEFRISENKNQFDINYELPKHTYVNNLQFSWKISNQRFTVKQEVDDDIGDTIITLPINSFINSFTSVLGLTVIHNNTNNFQFPTKGYFQSYLFEESGLLSYFARRVFDISTFSYFKFTTVHKFYINLSSETPSSILASKTLLGVIFEYGDNTLKVNGVPFNMDINLIPLETRFIAGGNTSVRGWPGKKLGTFKNMENGGNFLFEGNLEHRTKPFRNVKGVFKDLGFVTFLDYGNLWEEPSKFQFNQIALAIGGGFRYYTIVGPIRFDIGFKLYDYFAEEGTNKWLFNNSLNTILKNKIAFQFGIGNTF
ncbi:MAG: BamA/TamA family outer membrane protein [Ignavibacteria bacterium]